ncbi:MAG: FAD:protein FMN transferase, partial [Oscillospiraceae bacterium]|nr:FAD:protein FMN transferase [Oscillospiraceae bacterium]
IIVTVTGCTAESVIMSVTVFGSSGITCDGLWTALFVMGLDAAAEFWAANDDFEAVLVSESGEIYVTEGLSERFTPADKSAEVTVIARD